MPSKLSFNIGVLSAPAGFLKLFEILIGVVILSLCMTTQFPIVYVVFASGIMFIGNFPILVTTFLLFISILISPETANLIPKTIFELLFHVFGFAFYLTSALAMLILALKYLDGALVFEKAITISIIGLIILSLCMTTSFQYSAVSFASGIMFLGSFPFLATTFLLLISILLSPTAADMIPKTIFEFVFHILGFKFYLLSALAMLSLAVKYLEGQHEFEKGITISVLGLINCLLFSFSTYYSLKSCRAS